MHVLMCMIIQEVAGMCVCRGDSKNYIKVWSVSLALTA